MKVPELLIPEDSREPAGAIDLFSGFENHSTAKALFWIVVSIGVVIAIAKLG